MCLCNSDVVVLLTVYNRKTVSNTIESVLRQTYKNFQLLIIDNASNDGTYEMIQEYARTDNRIIVVRNEKNMGQTYSLRRGITMIKGKYIARIDADDLMMPTRLQKQYDFLEANSDYVLCGSWVQLITDDNLLGVIDKTCTTDSGIRVMQKLACALYHPTIMMRRNVLEENSLTYDENLKMAEDYDLWRQLLKYGKALNIGEVLTYYRRGVNNDSKSNSELTNKEACMVKERIYSEDKSNIYNIKLKNLLEISQKKRKSIYNAVSAYFILKEYIQNSLAQSSPDYIVLCRRVKFSILGDFIQNNTAIWARVTSYLYAIIRRRIYKSYKERSVLIARACDRLSS